jgi:outer membrane beta-barrel protein
MLLLTATLALAADVTKDVAKDTLDIGVLKNSEVKVVQKMLYRKAGTLELGAQLGVMPFDAYSVTPQLSLSGVKHLSDTVGLEVQLGGGYGLESGTYEELASATYGVAVESYRYLGSAEADLQYTLAYAKMNLGGKKVVHYDVYGVLGAGVSLEQSMLPSGDIALAPTVPVGVGGRFFATKTMFLKAELRDNLLVEHRAQSDTWGFKQNAVISLGLSVLTGGDK